MWISTVISTVISTAISRRGWATPPTSSTSTPRRRVTASSGWASWPAQPGTGARNKVIANSHVNVNFFSEVRTLPVVVVACVTLASLLQSRWSGQWTQRDEPEQNVHNYTRNLPWSSALIVPPTTNAAAAEMEHARIARCDILRHESCEQWLWIFDAWWRRQGRGERVLGFLNFTSILWWIHTIRRRRLLTSSTW